MPLLGPNVVENRKDRFYVNQAIPSSAILQAGKSAIPFSLSLSMTHPPTYTYAHPSGAVVISS